MTHNDFKLDLDCAVDEIRRAQNEISNERVEEYAIPASICSLDLDLTVQTKYHAIDTYDRAFSGHLN